MADMVFCNSELVEKYVHYRPTPPAELITTVVNFVKEKRPLPLQVCVDVGCGSGQSTWLYSSHFQQVFGLDVSLEQLEAAKKTSFHNVVYKEGIAESMPFEDNSVDLVASCEGAHWFNFEKFRAEVDRVLCPGGVLACYGYSFCQPTFAGRNLRPTMEEISHSVDRYHAEGHKHLLSEYTTLPDFYPEEVVRPSKGKFSVESDATLDSILGYISTWSAFSKLKSFEGEEASANFLLFCKQKLLDAMGTKEENVPMKTCYDYFLRMWRKPSA